MVHAVSSTSCTYRVNGDGTGRLDVTLTGAPIPLPELHSDFVIVDNGNETPFVLSDDTGGTLASGVSKRQNSGGSD
jgi:hypothetical protein